MAEPISVVTNDPWIAFAVILGTGIAGGITNCFLSGEGFLLPYLSRNKEGRTAWHPASLGNVFLGIGASFLVWAFGAHEISSWIKQAGICYLAGVGGSSVILSFVQKKQLDVAEARANEYRSMVIDELGEQAQEEDDDQER